MQNSEVIKPAPDDADDQDLATVAEAAARLASAFSTLAEFADFLPTNAYNAIADALNESCEGADWQSDPALMRLILPHILKAAIEKREREQFGDELEA
jgi:hypothetical protein